MKKIILLAVMSLALLYIGLISFSFAEDLAKGISEFTGEEMAEENVPMIFAQANTTTGDEKVEVEKEDEDVDEEEEDEPDEDDDDDDDEEVEVGVEGRERRERVIIHRRP